jgi:hypothetical protein
MFLMPAGAGGFLTSLWRRVFRTRHGVAPEPVVEIAAVSCEPAPGPTAMKAGAAFVERPVVEKAADGTRLH